MTRSEYDLHWRRVSAALSALLQRTNDDRFVIFSDQHTGKFVQFGDGPGGLLLDLPEQTLDKNERARAEHYFLQYDVRPNTSELYTDQTMTVPAGLHTTIQMELRQDVRKATRIVFDVFDRIYLLPHDFHLLIKEN
jgi:hypothetical protein